MKSRDIRSASHLSSKANGKAKDFSDNNSQASKALSKASVYEQKDVCVNCVNKEIIQEKRQREVKQKKKDEEFNSKNKNVQYGYLTSLKNQRQEALASQKQNHEILQRQIEEKNQRQAQEKKSNQEKQQPLIIGEYEDRRKQLLNEYAKDAKAQLASQKPKKKEPEMYKTTLDFSDSNPINRDSQKKQYAKELQNQISSQAQAKKEENLQRDSEWKKANTYSHTLEKEFTILRKKEEDRIRSDYRKHLEAQKAQKQLYLQKLQNEKEEMANFYSIQKRRNEEELNQKKAQALKQRENLSNVLKEQISTKEEQKKKKEPNVEPPPIETITKGECGECHRRVPMNLLTHKNIKIQ